MAAAAANFFLPPPCRSRSPNECNLQGKRLSFLFVLSLCYPTLIPRIRSAVTKIPFFPSFFFPSLIHFSSGDRRRRTHNTRWNSRPCCPPALPYPALLTVLSPRLGQIEMQVRSNLDRDEFLALYLVRRTNFWVSLLQKTFCLYQGSYGVLFCPFFLIRTFKIRNVLLSPYKDSSLSFSY